MRHLPVAVLAVAALILASCDKPKDEKQVTVNTGNGTVTMSGNNDQMTIKSNDGKAVLEVNTANAKLPSFVPAYPGAAVSTTMITAGAGTVVFTTDDGPQKVVDYYKSKVLSGDMKEAMTATSGETTMWTAQNEGQKKTVSVSATKTEGHTQVQVTWTNT